MHRRFKCKDTNIFLNFTEWALQYQDIYVMILVDRRGLEPQIRKGDIHMQSKTLKLFSGISAILLLCAIAANGFMYWQWNQDGNQDLVNYVCATLRILICAFGVYYLFLGGTKKIGAVLYKIYLALFILIQLFLLMAPNIYENPLQIILVGLRIASLCLLLSSINLGEVKSKIFGVVIVLTAVIALVVDLAGGHLDLTALVSTLTDAVMGISVFALVCGKYADKKARGSKT